jgi:hypothetical protein
MIWFSEQNSRYDRLCGNTAGFKATEGPRRLAAIPSRGLDSHDGTLRRAPA